MVIKNAVVQNAYALARRAAQTDVPVLVLGETGTGKEHLAASVHRASMRANAPFKVINCGAVPDNLIETLLFGHEKGAFTGADRRAQGVFEDASGGVVFLDEVAELSLRGQTALLRVLETRKTCRVGGMSEIDVDVRIVAATHRDLTGMVESDAFRRDLFYRLNAVTLELPPLRERPEELEPLVELFLEQVRDEWDLSVVGVATDTMSILRSYHWPGNIRQLRNVVERAALAAESSLITRVDLPRALLEHGKAPSPTGGAHRTQVDVTPVAGLDEKLRTYETKLLAETLRRAGGSRPAAAKELKVPLRTLYRRIRALGLQDREPES